MKLQKYGELAFGGIIAVFDIFYFIMTLQVQRKNSETVFDARFFPYLLCGIFAILAICQIWRGIGIMKQFSPETGIVEKSDTPTVIRTLVSILVYILLMEPLGFVLSTTLFLMAMFAILRPADQKPNYVLYGAVALVFSLFVYLSFRYILSIMLPQGLLTFF